MSTWLNKKIHFQFVEIGVGWMYDAKSGAKFFYCVKCIEILEANQEVCREKGV